MIFLYMIRKFGASGPCVHVYVHVCTCMYMFASQRSVVQQDRSSEGRHVHEHARAAHAGAAQPGAARHKRHLLQRLRQHQRQPTRAVGQQQRAAHLPAPGAQQPRVPRPRVRVSTLYSSPCEYLALESV